MFCSYLATKTRIALDATTSLINMGFQLLSFGRSWIMGYNTKQIKESVVQLHPETAYIEKQKSRLMATFLGEDTGSVYNASIDPRFYSIEMYDSVVQDANNELEASWKRRILIESTPRGSVMMYYDAFKQGFAYYSDQYIPYAVVNAVAMKYVVVYRCRDFFLDETILFDEKRSPFLDLQKEQERAEKDKKMVANKEKGLASIDVQKGPFAKLKHYSTNPVDGIKGDIVKVDTDTKEYAKNRVIHLGKWTNMKILATSSFKKSAPLKKLSEIPLNFKDYMAMKMQLKS